MEERARTNFDHPDALETSLLVQQLGKLQHLFSSFSLVCGQPMCATSSDWLATINEHHTRHAVSLTSPVQPTDFCGIYLVVVVGC